MSLFEARNICKTFPGVIALDHVDFSVEAGEIHALCGANGAGKSTLIKIISGVQPADSGEMLLDGNVLHFTNPHQAFQAGIGTIFQDFELAQNLTVAENISLGNLTNSGAFIHWNEVRAKACEILQELKINLQPDTMVSQLSIGEQQMVEIARVMSNHVKLLIMDEPTSSLSNEDVENLFALVRHLAKQGISIIYVSHRMEEIFELCDRITVFKDGHTQASFQTADVRPKDIIEAMVGHTDYEIATKKCKQTTEEVLCLNHFQSNLMKHPLSFSLKRQEVLGIAGLMGSGRTELLLSLFGLADWTSGSVQLAGSSYVPKNPKHAITQGIVMVPEDRRGSGFFPNLSVRSNIVQASYSAVKSGLLLSTYKERQLVDNCIRDFRIKTASPSTIISTLSGGNQQKVIFAKWLATNQKVLFLDEPTRGIDVAAKAEIYALTSEMVEKGLSVILVSSELKELLDICDRILILGGGEIIDEYDREHFDYDTINSRLLDT